jgi:hypothetical protein
VVEWVLLRGALGWGLPTGVLWNVAMHALGFPWPTGWLLILNVVAWPIGGAVWWWKMHRLLRQRVGKPPVPGSPRSNVDPF